MVLVVVFLWVTQKSIKVNQCIRKNFRNLDKISNEILPEEEYFKVNGTMCTI